MSKSTPGPWFVGTQNDGLYIIDGPPSPAPYDGPIPREYGPNVIATPNWHLAEYEANARLIAAAPDMLAALLAVVVTYKRNNPMRTADMHDPSCTCMRCAVDAADAAISKADAA